MKKSHGKGKFKPYNSPGHAHDQPVHNMPDPSGGMSQGDVQPGQPMGPMGSMGGAPDMAAQGGPPMQGM